MWFKKTSFKNFSTINTFFQRSFWKVSENLFTKRFSERNLISSSTFYTKFGLHFVNIPQKCAVQSIYGENTLTLTQYLDIILNAKIANEYLKQQYNGFSDSILKRINALAYIIYL